MADSTQTLDVVAAAGGTAGTVALPADLFDVKTNIPLIHQVVVAQQAAARQGTHSTKRRGEVSGAGRKPFKQKGTGNARQGSIRAPQMTGGGIVHGPKPRDYSQRTPKKMIAAALLGSLSDRARGDRLHVVDSFGVDGAPSTKTAAAVLAGLGAVKNVLVVLDRADEITGKSVRNIPFVHVLDWGQLNAYDVLVSDDIVFTKAAYDAFVAGRTGAEAPVEVVAAKPAKAAVAPTPAEVADGGFPNSAAPLADDAAPAGFTVKGNKDSMLYHLEGSRWYDQTVAEVWFRTAEDAEAAGFAAAGSKKES